MDEEILKVKMLYLEIKELLLQIIINSELEIWQHYLEKKINKPMD
jgi:hypothetical protein